MCDEVGGVLFLVAGFDMESGSHSRGRDDIDTERLGRGRGESDSQQSWASWWVNSSHLTMIKRKGKERKEPSFNRKRGENYPFSLHSEDKKTISLQRNCVN